MAINWTKTATSFAIYYNFQAGLLIAQNENFALFNPKIY